MSFLNYLKFILHWSLQGLKDLIEDIVFVANPKHATARYRFIGFVLWIMLIYDWNSTGGKFFFEYLYGGLIVEGFSIIQLILIDQTYDTDETETDN